MPVSLKNSYVTIFSLLFRMAKALGLIGVQTIFIGISPEIAQAVIHLGIDFKGIKTMKSLEQALVNR